MSNCITYLHTWQHEVTKLQREIASTLLARKQERITALQQPYRDMPMEELLPEIAFPLDVTARNIAEDIQQINADLQQELQSLLTDQQKSLVAETTTSSEATDAFNTLTFDIVHAIRERIDAEIEKQVALDKTDAEITEHIENLITHYQDNTIPHKMQMLTHHFNGKLSEIQQRDAGYEYYVWRTQNDENVRDHHAEYEGLVFRWDNPSPSGHPGEEHNCRCWAEPIRSQDITGHHRFYYIEDHPVQGAEEFFPEFIIPVIALRGAILESLEAIGKAVGKIFKKDKPISKDTSTKHGVERGKLRKISDEEAQEALESAKKSGNVETKIGKYGTKQKHYKGDNGVTVIVETEGRNTGKIITVWRHDK